MRWLLPLTLVLIVALLFAAAHFLFMRWMTRQRVEQSDDDR
jgi:hypothetical protein